MTTKQLIAYQPKVTASQCFTPARAGLLQRKCSCGGSPRMGGECEACRKKRTSLQRRPSNSFTPQEVPSIVHEELQSPGQPLDPTTLAFMESRFGHDFSQVRVHTSARGSDSARLVNAQAYTVGQHIVFGAGQFAPSDSAGVNLIAHELTHVLQQQNSNCNGNLEIAPPDGAHEQEADRVAQRVIRSHLSSPLSIREPLGEWVPEDEDIPISVEPDPEYLYQNGTTTCTFPGGTPSTVINNTGCTRTCTTRHEAIHAADISPCCAKAGTAYQAATTPAAQQTVSSQFFTWMNSNRSWFECRAYAESVRCADDEMATKNCTSPAPADAACCTELAAYRLDKETRRASNCASAAAALSDCPFP